MMVAIRSGSRSGRDEDCTRMGCGPQCSRQASQEVSPPNRGRRHQRCARTRAVGSRQCVVIQSPVSPLVIAEQPPRPCSHHVLAARVSIVGSPPPLGSPPAPPFPFAIPMCCHRRGVSPTSAIFASNPVVVTVSPRRPLCKARRQSRQSAPCGHSIAAPASTSLVYAAAIQKRHEQGVG